MCHSKHSIYKGYPSFVSLSKNYKTIDYDKNSNVIYYMKWD